MTVTSLLRKTEMNETIIDEVYPHQTHSDINMPTWVGDCLPERGACPICGLDARHRLVDAIRDAVHDHVRVEDLAKDYGLPVAFVYRLIKERPYQRDSTTRR
jgi:hypothetical protein